VTRWLPFAAAAALAVGAVSVLVMVVQPAAPITRQDEARTLAAELRCPDCESLSVAESRTAAAAAIRTEIDQQLAAGRSPADIRASFVARYGEWILLEPMSPLVWLLPVLALLIGTALFGWWLFGRDRGRRSRPGVAPGMTQPSIAELERIREEAEGLDG